MNEREYLEAYDANKFDRPSVTADVMLLRMNKNTFGSLQVLLVKRSEHPFKDNWALPGTFIKMKESAYSAACRALKEKTGVTNIYLEQLYTMSQPNRDPRTRVMSIAYMGLLPYDADIVLHENAKWFDVILTADHMIVESDDVSIQYKLAKKHFNNGVIDVENTHIKKLTSKEALAFDHQEIILEGIMKLRKDILHEDYAFNLVAKTFTLVDLTQVYEVVLGKKMYKNALKRDRVGDKLEPTGELMKPITSQRSATAYRYRKNT